SDYRKPDLTPTLSPGRGRSSRVSLENSIERDLLQHRQMVLPLPGERVGVRAGFVFGCILRAQLFSSRPSRWPRFFTGANIACTSRSSVSSIGSAAHRAHWRMFAGFALPATVVAMSGCPRLN